MAITVLPNISVLVSVWLESVFYGSYIVIFFAASIAMSMSKNAHLSCILLRLVATLMFCISTAHVGINLLRLIEAFVIRDNKEDTLAYLYDIHQPLNIAKQYLWTFNNVMADGLIVWRLYVVWNTWVCITPIALLLGTTAFGLITASFLITLSNPGDTIFIKDISRFATAQFAMSLTDNVLVTLLIAGRIWYVTRDVRRDDHQSGSQYRRIMLIIIESGALYAVTQIFQLAFYVAKFPGLYFVADSFVQIMAIVPTAMILLVALGRTPIQTMNASEKLSNVRFASWPTRHEEGVDMSQS